MSYQRQLSNDLHIGMLVRHGLRHTAVTWMADARVDLRILQGVAGHQDPAVTARYLVRSVVAGRYRRRQECRLNTCRLARQPLRSDTHTWAQSGPNDFRT